MARPRKSPHLKNQPITISLPPKMIAEIDELLSYQANRSAWIQGAINIRLHGDTMKTPNQIAAQLLYILQNSDRDSISASTLKNLKELI